MKPKLVKMPLFNIEDTPKINISNLRHRRFDIIDREIHCPVCSNRVENLHEHISSMTDIDHIIYEIHNK